jgi:hypothetical protein
MSLLGGMNNMPKGTVEATVIEENGKSTARSSTASPQQVISSRIEDIVDVLNKNQDLLSKYADDDDINKIFDEFAGFPREKIEAAICLLAWVANSEEVSTPDHQAEPELLMKATTTPNSKWVRVLDRESEEVRNNIRSLEPEARREAYKALIKKWARLRFNVIFAYIREGKVIEVTWNDAEGKWIEANT